MKITNKKYNINVTTYTLGLLEGYITQQEFELLCLIPKSQSKVTHDFSEEELVFNLFILYFFISLNSYILSNYFSI